MSTPYTPPAEVELLILGSGWTAEFLISLLKSEGISHAATTRDGRNDTIKFTFDPDSTNPEQYEHLPRAKTVLITFPLKGAGQANKLTSRYWDTHARIEVNFILLGSTGIYKEGDHDYSSGYDKGNLRAVAEDELIEKGGTVLSLAGLYGDRSRVPRTWVRRVARTKEQLMEKDSLHLVHGDDVARAILQTHRLIGTGERWIVTDRHVYDWWDLVDGWADEITAEWDEEADGPVPPYRKWVEECMQEAGVRFLPRTSFKRTLDSRDFWKTMKTLPARKLERLLVRMDRHLTIATEYQCGAIAVDGNNQAKQTWSNIQFNHKDQDGESA